jgi:transposase
MSTSWSKWHGGSGCRKEDEALQYDAIDIHSSSSALGIINPGGERLWKCTLPNDLVTIRAAPQQVAAGLQGIVVESAFNWYWLVNGLQEAGYTVHPDNTTASKQYKGHSHSDDESEASWLVTKSLTGCPPNQSLFCRGLNHRRPGKRAKSVSVETSSA